MSCVTFRKCLIFIREPFFFAVKYFALNQTTFFLAYTLYSECLHKFGDSFGSNVWSAINNAFDVMPVAALIDKKVIFFFCIT